MDLLELPSRNWAVLEEEKSLSLSFAGVDPDDANYCFKETECIFVFGLAVW